MSIGVESLKRKYRFPVSQQANLIGLEWQKLSTFAMTQADRFDEKKHRTAFMGPLDRRGYHWSYPTNDYPSTFGRFLSYYVHEVTHNEGTIYELYMKETEFPTQLEEVLALRLGEAETAVVEFMGMHEDRVRFYGRDLGSGKEFLYSPNDYLSWWTPPIKPAKDACFMQVHRAPLRSINVNVAEAVLLTAPTYYTGNELRARSLTCLRLCPNGLSAYTLEKKIWSHAHWMDFCVDMPIPSENYLQALVRWEEYLGKELEDSWSFPALLHEVELSPNLVNRIATDLQAATIAIPELEWVLESLWNEQPRVSLWGRTPRQMGKFLCNQDMLDEVVDAIKAKGKANLLPRHVLMARPLEGAPAKQ
jgi:hypothetical protein